MSLLDTLGFDDPTVVPDPLKLDRSGELLTHLFQDCHPGQHDREAIKNALEAGATEVWVTPDWRFVEARVAAGLPPVYRYSVWDNGHGMDEEGLEALQMLSHSGDGKQMGLRENFGLGARTALLAGSPEGVLFFSYRDGVGNWTKLYRDKVTGNFVGARLPVPGTESPLYEPVVAAPSEYDNWVNGTTPRPCGTVVVAVGESPEDNTWETLNPVSDSMRQHSLFINRRFFSFPAGVTVRAYENDRKAEWPLSFAEATSRVANADYRAHGQFRHCRGREYFLRRYCDLRSRGLADDESDLDLTVEELAALDRTVPVGNPQMGSIPIPEGEILWYYCDDEVLLKKAQGAHAYASVFNCLGVVYQDEVYEEAPYQRFFSFGLFAAAVTKRTAIFIRLDPEKCPSILPHSSRSGLRDLRHPAHELPWPEWGRVFRENMPVCFREAAADSAQTTEFSEIVRQVRTDLADRFRDRLGIRAQAPRGKGATVRGTSTGHGSHSQGDGDPKRSRHEPGLEWRPEILDSPRPLVYLKDEHKIIICASHPSIRAPIDFWVERLHANEAQAIQVQKVAQYAFSMAILSRANQALQFRGTPFWSKSHFDALWSDEALTWIVLGAEVDLTIQSKLAYMGAKAL